MPARLDRFERAVRETTASATRVTPAQFEAALEEVLVAPAVGAPLPFDEVSLADVALAGGPLTLEPTRDELLGAATGVSGARLAIAAYGSVVLESTTDVDELVALFPERHVVVVRDRDVVPDMPAAFAELAPRFAGAGDAVIATGPSATADMGELVYGAHGPKDVHVLLVSTGAGGTGAAEGEGERATDDDGEGGGVAGEDAEGENGSDDDSEGGA